MAHLIQVVGCEVWYKQGSLDQRGFEALLWNPFMKVLFGNPFMTVLFENPFMAVLFGNPFMALLFGNPYEPISMW